LGRGNSTSDSLGELILILDTTFLVLHYSDDEGILTKTRGTLRVSRKLGNRAILPTIVLAEFYAQTYKRTGKDVAHKALEGSGKVRPKDHFVNRTDIVPGRVA
jgi:predicted nucleic acid-binding protein